MTLYQPQMKMNDEVMEQSVERLERETESLVKIFPSAALSTTNTT
jgi:hypothetical protein